MTASERRLSWLYTLLTASAFSIGAKAQSFTYMDRQGTLHMLSVDERDPVIASEDLEGQFPFASVLAEAARTHSVPLQLLRAVMAVESGFRPGARSAAGACGLMQLMPATAAELGVRDPFDPRENVMGAARMLRQLLDRFTGRLRLVLAAYNAGVGAVVRSEGVPPYPETRRYVRRVLSLYYGFSTASAAEHRRGAP